MSGWWGNRAGGCQWDGCRGAGAAAELPESSAQACCVPALRSLAPNLTPLAPVQNLNYASVMLVGTIALAMIAWVVSVRVQHLSPASCRALGRNLQFPASAAFAASPVPELLRPPAFGHPRAPFRP